MVRSGDSSFCQFNRRSDRASTHQYRESTHQIFVPVVLLAYCYLLVKSNTSHHIIYIYFIYFDFLNLLIYKTRLSKSSLSLPFQCNICYSYTVDSYIMLTTRPFDCTNDAYSMYGCILHSYSLKAQMFR